MSVCLPDCLSDCARMTLIRPQPLFRCSLKLECEKLAQEKTEIQRQYIMVSITEGRETILRLTFHLTKHCRGGVAQSVRSTTLIHGVVGSNDGGWMTARAA